MDHLRDYDFCLRLRLDDGPMSIALVALVTLCYVGVAISEAWAGNTAMAVVFAGYSFANIGLIMGLAA